MGAARTQTRRVPQVIRIDVKAQLLWKAHRDPSSQYWVAVCDAIKLAAEGETWDDLQEMVADELRSLFVDLLREGELDAFLRDRGWTLVSPVPMPAAQDNVKFDIPWSIIPTNSAGVPAHA